MGLRLKMDAVPSNLARFILMLRKSEHTQKVSSQ